MFDTEHELNMLIVESAFNNVTKKEFNTLKYKIKNSKDLINAFMRKRNRTKAIAECDHFIAYMKETEKKIQALPYTDADMAEDLMKSIASSIGTAIVFNKVAGWTKKQDELNDMGKYIRKNQQMNRDEKIRAFDMLHQIKKDKAFNQKFKDEQKQKLPRDIAASVLLTQGGKMAYQKLVNKGPTKEAFAKWKRKICTEIRKNIKWAEQQKALAEKW